MRQCVQWTESCKQKEQNNNHVTRMAQTWTYTGTMDLWFMPITVLGIPGTRASLTNPWTSFLQLAASLSSPPETQNALCV